jgi:phosphatidylserine/phosphatidylglycerophosphate/cardiolipin synthase-like enzyme
MTSAPPLPRSLLTSVRTESAVEWLIDNEETYLRLHESIESAEKYVWIAQLALDADCRVAHAASDNNDTLLEALLRADAERNVDVRLVLNTSMLLDTRKPLLKFLRKSGKRSGIDIRGTNAFPQLMHAKVVIVDGKEGFLLGSPLVNDYWDASTHEPVDPARPTRELAGRPLHDVSVAITGPAVADLEKAFAEIWNCSNVGLGTHDRLPIRSRAKSRSDTVSVAATKPLRPPDAAVQTTTDNLDELVQAIRAAEKLIYIEHQYLSSRDVANELADALKRNDSLEIVIVINQNPDITAYQRWQNERLLETGLLHHPRVGTFSLWCAADLDGVPTINQIFVHSKVVLIDDSWALVGSANLDGISLDSYGKDFTGRFARRIFRDLRNFEVGVVIRSDASDEKPGTVRNLRNRLWSEHLGHSDIGELEYGLSEFKSAADTNLESLRSAAKMHGRILPYSTQMLPSNQLLEMGIDISPSSMCLAFNPSWFNARFCPNWIRNMFL